MKSFNDAPNKKLWRDKIIDFIRKHYTPTEIKNAHVLCLPGPEMKEVFDVYDTLGVKRINIVGLESHPKAHKALTSLNSSLEKKIKVVNQTDLQYLSKVDVTPFDIVSLDYCGYLDQAKRASMSQMAIREWLRPKAVLITNYQMSRENRETKAIYEASRFFAEHHEDFLKSSVDEAKQFILDNKKKLIDVEDYDALSPQELAVVRDFYVQSTPISVLDDGTGFWNTELFDTITSTYYGEARAELMEQVEKFNHGRAGVNKAFLIKVVSSCMYDENASEAATGLFCIQSKFYDLEDHEAYKYVSKQMNQKGNLSNTPMISDFYLFRQSRPPRELQKYIRFEADGNHVILSKIAKDAKYFRALDAVEDHMLDRVKRTDKIFDGLPLERKILGNEISIDAKPRKRKTAKKQSDYSLDDNISQNGNQYTDKPTHEFDEGEKQVILDLFEEGHDSKAILELFDDKYAWQKIAAVKAVHTRQKRHESSQENYSPRSGVTP